LAYIFINMLQSLYVGFVGNFHEKYSGIYYTFQPLSYLVVTCLKLFIYQFDLKPWVDVSF
jgi:hypothetical protein